MPFGVFTVFFGQWWIRRECADSHEITSLPSKQCSCNPFYRCVLVMKFANFLICLFFLLDIILYRCYPPPPLLLSTLPCMIASTQDLEFVFFLSSHTTYLQKERLCMGIWQEFIPRNRAAPGESSLTDMNALQQVTSIVSISIVIFF